MVSRDPERRIFGGESSATTAEVFGQDYVDPLAGQPDPTLEPVPLWYRMDTPPGLGGATASQQSGETVTGGTRRAHSPEPFGNPFASPPRAAPVFDQQNPLPGTGFQDDSLYRSQTGHREGEAHSGGTGQASQPPVTGGGSGDGQSDLLRQLIGQIGGMVQTQHQILARLDTLENQQQGVASRQGVPVPDVSSYGRSCSSSSPSTFGCWKDGGSRRSST